MYSRGEIVLIPVPFTDLTSSKKRPVVILSNNKYNSGSDDLICLAITSQIRGFETEIIISTDDLIEGMIPKESCIRADKIYTLNESIIVKKYGKLKEIKLEAALKQLEQLISE